MAQTRKKSDLKPADIYRGFSVKRVESLESIKVKAFQITHEKTGAEVLHLQCDDPENLFSVGFRTPPRDSTGVAHILEHSVLAGSEKYPVKDAFNELAKGTLQTFINAFTFPDKTLYPVASQVKARLLQPRCGIFGPCLEAEAASRDLLPGRPAFRTGRPL